MAVPQCHVATNAVLLWTLLHLHGTLADVSQPFTHDFRTGLHRWHMGDQWKWSGHDGFPNNQTLSTDGDYLWIQETLQNDESSPLSNMVFYNGSVCGVTKQTKFQVKYLIHSIDVHCASLDIVMTSPGSKSELLVGKVVGHAAEHTWTNYTIDCGQEKCCEQYNCDLIMAMKAHIECPGDADVSIAIQSVSGTCIGRDEGHWSLVTELMPLFAVLSCAVLFSLEWWFETKFIS